MVPPPEHPKALPLDPDEGLAAVVHEEHLAAAVAAVVVDAEGHAAVGAVHGAAVAVEHQRLHPHRVHGLLLEVPPLLIPRGRAGGRRCGCCRQRQGLDLGH